MLSFDAATTMPCAKAAGTVALPALPSKARAGWTMTASGGATVSIDQRPTINRIGRPPSPPHPRTS